MRKLDGFRWYRCHKEVHAVKIESIDAGRPEVTIIPEGDAEPFTVSLDWYRKHNPVPGGYFVVYEDGYESYSPAKAFESGYSEI